MNHSKKKIFEQYHFSSTSFIIDIFENFNFYFLKMCSIFVGSEVVQGILYQKSIGAEFTHLYIFIFIVLWDYRDLPQSWTP